MKTKPEKINKSAERVIDLLLLLSGSDKALTLNNICEMMQIPKSSAFELVQTLIYKGIVEVKDPINKTYGLSILAFEIGSAVVSNLSVVDIAKPFIQELNRKTGSTVFLGMEDKGKIVYLDKAESHSVMRPTAKLGSARHLHTTGLGKALLAAFPDRKIAQLLGSEPYPTKTPLSKTNLTDVLSDANLTRQNGYSIDDREDNLEMYCIGTAIYNHTNLPIASCSVASLYSGMTEEKEQIIAKLVTQTAMQISRKLGFTGHKPYLL
ncbi:IclR family transcriptional regulator [Leminorella grimontii]|uniref:HTH-type transcriptional repressor AllR n=1 Tax=Leminorella grimontii TaxID=82981 RepID=A0AAV5MYM4_9GAMM|nr:IclR family transcriptional regulator [Leminorella grimontii]KFC97678.1 IclR family transcriptional regulator [Leminorella grimontii ATCC 33999 = DSM 5078]GKX54960.1 IclR family transcriptional regulator [Leminorella grimontii]GKX58386.1 IclR family transcriptional regulator [Leminorella grimontii]VFS57180.1 Negative regulator of allantoin and glyoxylate utilization operons [Leminorella grimontii]